MTIFYNYIILFKHIIDVVFALKGQI
jgi:hypothetical protein